MADQLRVGLISVARIAAHPSNIGRDLGDLRELVASVREKGVLVPVVIEEHGGAGYRLRDGHRRLAAARLARVDKVTALIHAEALNEADWLIESLDYNERRKGYTDDDKRRVAQRLLELGVKKGAIGEAFGCSWSKIARLIDPPAAAPVDQAAAKPARLSPVISRKTVREFADHCQQHNLSGTAVLVLLRALADGMPWKVDEEVGAHA